MKISILKSILLVLVLVLLPLNTSWSITQQNKQIRSNKNLFKLEKVTLVDNVKKDNFQKYNVLLGSFSTLEDATKVKDTFVKLKEQPFVVKNSKDEFYVLIHTCKYADVVVLRMKDVVDKYVKDLSEEERLGRYNTTLDDMRILEVE